MFSLEVEGSPIISELLLPGHLLGMLFPCYAFLTENRYHGTLPFTLPRLPPHIHTYSLTLFSQSFQGYIILQCELPLLTPFSAPRKRNQISRVTININSSCVSVIYPFNLAIKLASASSPSPAQEERLPSFISCLCSGL